MTAKNEGIGGALGKLACMGDEGQGAFEYILMATGAILLVVMVIVIVRDSTIPAISDQINESTGNLTGMLGAFNQTQ